MSYPKKPRETRRSRHPRFFRFREDQRSHSNSLHEIAEQLKPDDVDLLLNRIETIAKTARIQWIILLSLMVYTSTIMLSIKDIDFFVPREEIYLPFLAIDIPPLAFFYASSIFIFSIFMHFLHLIQKLWIAIANAPSQPRDRPLGMQAFPWLLVDTILYLKNDDAIKEQGMSPQFFFVTNFLIWAAAPIVLFWLWWQSMTAHDTFMSSVLGFLALSSLWSWRLYLTQRHAFQKQPTRLLKWSLATLSIVTVLFVILITLARTVGAIPWIDENGRTIQSIDFLIYAKPETTGVLDFSKKVFKRKEILYTQQNRFKRLIADYLPSIQQVFWFAPIDLRGIGLVNMPDDWKSPSAQEDEFHHTYCEGNESCKFIKRNGTGFTKEDLKAHEDWCKVHAPETDCIERIRRRNDWYQEGWKSSRRKYLSKIAALDLRYVDLRGADLRGAFLPNVDLSGAQLDFAKLDNTVLEGAKLDHASFRGAFIWGSSFQFANMWSTDLSSAIIISTDFSYAELRSAKLINAYVWQSEFIFTNMMGSNFGLSSITGSNFSGSVLSETGWTKAEVDGITVFNVDFSYLTGMKQSQLDKMIGNDSTILTQQIAEDSGEFFRIAKCWREHPDSYRYIPSKAGFIYTRNYIHPWLCDGENRKWIDAQQPFVENEMNRIMSTRVPWKISSDWD